MKHKYTPAVFALIAFGALLLLAILLHSATFAVLEPQGPIAGEERSLMVEAVLLMLVVVVPVLLLAFFFAWWYREGNTKAVYMPDWEHSKMDELVWWAIPFEIILILAALTWTSTHVLDPTKPLASAATPITIEVVALDWKWLFIYPQEGIATVNYVEFPQNTPVDFEITADAPMNSFWIPQLGGQIYAMTGMVNQLHLMADETGDFLGVSSNYSGAGFSKMQFVARAVTEAQYNAWVARARESSSTLTTAAYAALAQPSIAAPETQYGTVQQNLFQTIVEPFMTPMSRMSDD